MRRHYSGRWTWKRSSVFMKRANLGSVPASAPSLDSNSRPNKVRRPPVRLVGGVVRIGHDSFVGFLLRNGPFPGIARHVSTVHYPQSYRT